MEWLIGLAVIAVVAVVLIPAVTASGLALATPSVKREKPAERLARRAEIAAQTFNGDLNVSFRRDPGDPITPEMLLEDAGLAGYRLVTVDTNLGVKTYHFTRAAS